MNRIVALLAATAVLVSATGASAQTRFFMRVVVQPVASAASTGGTGGGGKDGKTYTCQMPSYLGIPSRYPSASERIGRATTPHEAQDLCNARTVSQAVCYWNQSTVSVYYSPGGVSSTAGNDPQGFQFAACG